MGKSRTKVSVEEELDEMVQLEEEEPDLIEFDNTQGVPVINGRPLKLVSKARSETTFAPIRMWDKEQRSSLPPETRQIFYKSVTGYVLAKNNKLSAPQVVTSGDNKTLVQVLSLQSQLKTIKAHLITHDVYEVCRIVVPLAVRQVDTLEEEIFDLFEDYHQLHAVLVANSNTWYNRWVENDYIRENMALIYTFLQHNTEESLWNRCLDLYEE